MTQKPISLLALTQELQEKKHQKRVYHELLIESNRECKRLRKLGEPADKADNAANHIRAKIAELNAAIRAMEHDVSVLTVLVCQQASIEETPYGRVIRYHTEDTMTQDAKASQETE